MPQDSSSLSVWLVEDDRRYRTMMATVLDNADRIHCPNTFDDAEALLRALDPVAEAPDVLLLDIHLPGPSGIEVLPRIRALVPETSVLILTIAEKADLIFRAFQSGASGYLIKDASVDDILAAVRQAAAGGTLMPPAVAEHVFAHFREASGEEYDLTGREREVLRLMTKGLSQRQIADRLHVSPHTVNSHVQNLYAKLQVNSGIEAVVKAVREQLV